MGLLRGSVHSARAQDGASGRAGGAVAGGPRGGRRRLLRHILLLVAQLRYWAPREHRREPTGTLLESIKI